MTATSVEPQVWLSASTTPPEIVCPPWCDVSPREHLEELNTFEGACLHRSIKVTFAQDDGDSTTVVLTDFTNVDGSLTADGHLTVDINERDHTPAEAARLAHHILELVKVARA